MQNVQALKIFDNLYFGAIIYSDKFFGARCKSLPTVKVRERFGAGVG
jgi:hypothetical protein